MPALIWFILTRFSTGFAIGCVAGLAIWQGGHWSVIGNAQQHYLAVGLFLYLFASSFGIGYLSTALMLDEPAVD